MPGLLGLFWLLFVVNRFIFGQTSSFSLKIRLSFWFLAFCAVPAGLLFGTWSVFAARFQRWPNEGTARSFGETTFRFLKFVQVKFRQECRELVNFW